MKYLLRLNEKPNLKRKVWGFCGSVFCGFLWVSVKQNALCSRYTQPNFTYTEYQQLA